MRVLPGTPRNRPGNRSDARSDAGGQRTPNRNALTAGLELTPSPRADRSRRSYYRGHIDRVARVFPMPHRSIHGAESVLLFVSSLARGVAAVQKLRHNSARLNSLRITYAVVSRQKYASQFARTWVKSSDLPAWRCLASSYSNVIFSEKSCCPERLAWQGGDAKSDRGGCSALNACMSRRRAARGPQHDRAVHR